MKFFRVENLNTENGLWYNGKGQPSQIVDHLDLSGRNLPMDFDPTVANDCWKSAAESIEQLGFWFTKEDLEKLIPLGYNLYEIECDAVSYHKTDFYEHPLFQEQGVRARKVLDIHSILKGV